MNGADRRTTNSWAAEQSARHAQKSIAVVNRVTNTPHKKMVRMLKDKQAFGWVVEDVSLNHRLLLKLSNSNVLEHEPVASLWPWS